MVASGLCMIHCLATPLIFVAQACSVSCCTSGPWWWSLIDYLFLVVSYAAIHFTTKNTSSKWMPYALYGSWGLLALLMFHERFPFVNNPHAMIYVPALVLVGCTYTIINFANARMMCAVWVSLRYG